MTLEFSRAADRLKLLRNKLDSFPGSRCCWVPLRLLFETIGLEVPNSGVIYRLVHAHGLHVAWRYIHGT